MGGSFDVNFKDAGPKIGLQRILGIKAKISPVTIN